MTRDVPDKGIGVLAGIRVIALRDAPRCAAMRMDRPLIHSWPPGDLCPAPAKVFQIFVH